MPPTTHRPAPPELSTGREIARIIALAWPIAAAQLALVAMSLVDTAIVGRISALELAGVATGRSIAFAVITPALGVTSALEALASQAVGSGAPREAWGALRATLRGALLLTAPAVLVAFAVVLALEPFGVQHAIVRRAEWFMLGQLPGQFAFGMFFAAKTYLQAHGITRPALVAALAANVVNVVACSLLVLGDDALRAVHLPGVGLPRLGALGAGLANSIATVFLAVWLLGSAWRARPAGPPHPVPVSRALRLGLPIGLQLLAEVGVFTLVALLAGRLGAVVASAHQVALGLASFTFMGALGVSAATAVRVGHAVGAGTSPRRAGLLGIAVGTCMMSVGAVAFALVPGPLVRLFTHDPAVIALGRSLLGIAALFQLFDGAQTVAAGALRGAGDVRFPFVANVACHWLIGLPIALALGFGLHLGAAGLWWGLTAGLVTVAVTLTARFARISRGHIARV
ncbi:MAG: MATE family efflux transporter [Deltaproteobacteria bacterium]